MSPSWTSDLALLDSSLTLPCESLEEFKALQTVDVAAVLKQLAIAAETVHRLRSAVMEVLPEASWQTREELDALLVRVEWIERARSRLLALATKLDGANIVHRRAHRVEQLNKLRTQAIRELRSHAESAGEPPILPGPEVEKWVIWACSLKEPEDSAALEVLHKEFPGLDDFVTNLELGMWEPKTGSEKPLTNGVELMSLINEVREELRSRLLALATELERGCIVHHRALRINQLNQLREQAIKELRSYASVEGEPPLLPGPEASRWIDWACGLKESEDAETLQTLRSGFARVDDFVANLEPDMWIGGEPKPAEAELERAKSGDDTRQERQPEATFLEDQNSAAPVAAGSDFTSQRSPLHEIAPTPGAATPPPQAEEAVPDKPIPEYSLVERDKERVSHLIDKAHQTLENSVCGDDGTESSSSETFLAVLRRGVQKIPWVKWRIPLAVGAGLLLSVVLIGIRISHRAHAKASVTNVSMTSVSTPTGLQNTPSNVPETAANSNSADGSTRPQNAIESNHEDSGNALKQLAAAIQPATKAGKDGNGSTAAPIIVLPDDLASTRNQQSATDRGVQDAPPPSLQTGAPNNIAGIVTNTPVPVPKLAPQQSVRISSASAQQLVVSQVSPNYPAAARYMHIQGTVVVEAVIGKDGKIISLRATSGHPLLIQAALDAVKQWQFKPYYLNGVPVEAGMQISVKFGTKAD